MVMRLWCFWELKAKIGMVFVPWFDFERFSFLFLSLMGCHCHTTCACSSRPCVLLLNIRCYLRFTSLGLDLLGFKVRKAPRVRIAFAKYDWGLNSMGDSVKKLRSRSPTPGTIAG